MKTLQRLYMKDFFRLLFLIAAGLSIIFSIVEMINRIDDFPSMSSLVLYSLFNTPKFFIYLLPMSVLICSLFTFGQAFRRREIMAIKAAGGRLRTLFYPFIAAGIILSIVSFLAGEILVPYFSKQAIELKKRAEGKGEQLAFNGGSLWLKSKDGSPVKIDLYIVDKKIAKGIDIFLFGKEFLKERIIADRAFWNGKTWILEDITKYDIETGKIEKLRRMNYPGLESPDLFSEEIRKPDEMRLFELYRYIQRLKDAGFQNKRLIVDLNSKISFPLINIFMMMLGISLSAREKLGGGLFSAGLGLLISLFYWFGYTFMLSMGYAGIIPPYVSAWTIPFVFAVFAVYLFVKIPE
ncbi:MAG: LptF/LptG family permease [Nitrospirota bacterium]|nr:LptF/LptG family permease [Nitrospirota bacterium]